MLKDSGAGEYHEVFLREGLQDPPIDITSSFTLADGTPPTKDRLHANIDLPLGTHEVWVVQHKGANSWQSAKRQFSLVTGLATEYGALTGLDGGTAGKVVTQAIGGAVERPAPASDLALLFGETDLNGGTVHPSTIAFSTDTDPTDGITTSYYDEAGIGTIEAALGPLV
ncbi:MAG: hypothetical protein GY937_21945 [bacterium]|nr:hypothetical protein [bacterium]